MFLLILEKKPCRQCFQEKEMMRCWNAVASAEPYANNRHLAPDKWPHQHLITQFFTSRVLFLTPNQQCQSTEGWMQTEGKVNNIMSPCPPDGWMEAQKQYNSTTMTTGLHQSCSDAADIPTCLAWYCIVIMPMNIWLHCRTKQSSTHSTVSAEFSEPISSESALLW